MKVFVNHLLVVLRDDSRGENYTLPSSAWARVWTKVQNPFGFGEETWVSFPFDSVPARLPVAGEYLEAGTACKTIRGRVVKAEEVHENLGEGEVDVEYHVYLQQPGFPYGGPPIEWGQVLMPRGAIQADCLGNRGRLVPMVDGAYRSIQDGGDVAVVLPTDATAMVKSSLSEDVVTLEEYEALRQEKIPDGGPLPEGEQAMRDVSYLMGGNRAQARAILG